MLFNAIGFLGILLYLAGAVIQFRTLSGPSDNESDSLAAPLGTQTSHKQPLSTWLGWAALALHTVSVITEVFYKVSVLAGVFKVASLVGWFIILLTLVSSIRKPLHNLFIGLYPLAALTLLASILLPNTKDPIAFSPEISAHILLSILAYSVLTVAALQALVVSYQEHQLRAHLTDSIMRLPPLQAMEQLLFEWLGVGLLCLTASIITGFIYLEDLFAQSVVHKTVLSLVAWVILSALMLGRFILGWRGTLAVKLTIGSYLLLMLAYFGSKMVLELILNRV